MTKSRTSIPTRNNTVLGVDPGFDRVGVAVLDKTALLFSDCIVTDRKQTHAERLLFIGEALQKIIKKWKPKALAIETLFFNQNTTSAIGVAQARGVILYEAARAGLSVSEYGPQAVKIAVTGYGKADKLQMASMIKRLVVLPETSKKRLDDELDAIAVGITALASQKGI
ncbi:MAG: crossover junction endodeoxyribonuclease RuvC [bacterium]|nr:crossover junction endodeoxyribonuclease RuvC [bacterium]